MDARFAERLRLAPLAHAAIAILKAVPGLGLVLRATPGPMREAFMTALMRSGPFETARTVSLRDLREISAPNLPLMGAARRKPAAQQELPDARPLVLTGADRYQSADPAILFSHFGEGHPLIAFDEGHGEETIPDILSEKLGLWIDLNAPAPDDDLELSAFGAISTAARPHALEEAVDCEAAIPALCEIAASFGIAGVRAPILALRTARVSAALRGHTCVRDEDVLLACRLVLAPRARQAPSFESPSPDEARSEQPDATEGETAADTEDEKQGGDGAGQTSGNESDRSESEDAEIATTEISLPLDLLKRLASNSIHRRPSGSRSREGAATRGPGERGRPVGSRAGDPRRAPLDVAGTLTAALPWQTFRKHRFPRLNERSVILMPGDIRVKRLKARRETATIFVVDASGSAALARLAEAKGAVERILAECYRRRDRVAMVAFRGTEAEILLPETRSLTRARRVLASLAAGGGTPLAAGIAQAAMLAERCERQGRTPLLVFLTDGKANIALNGVAGRPAAREDFILEANELRARGFASLVIDLSLRPGRAGEDLADALGGNYLPLPNGDASALAGIVASDPTKASRP